MMATTAGGFQAIEDREADLRERLKLFENRVVTGVEKITATQTEVAANDHNLKKILRLVEAQLSSTAEVAQAALSQTQSAGAPPVTSMETAEIMARCERIEVFIKEVEQASCTAVAENHSNGQSLWRNVEQALNEIKTR